MKILERFRKLISGMAIFAMTAPMFFMGATPALAASINVCTSGCAYTTIQAAVDVAASGDTINVATGTYTEVGQIVINKNLNIVGADKATTIIKPAQDTADNGDGRGWFLIQPGITFNLSNVTLDGTGHSIFMGLYYWGNGTVNNINVNNIKFSQYEGRGIIIKGNVNVTNSEFTQMGRIGVQYFGGSGIASGNTFTGKGTGDWLDYGVELGNGAVATISNNTVTGNTGFASSDGSTSAGILVTTYFGPGTTATITGNTVTSNTDGIAVGYDSSDTSTVTAHQNNLSGNADTGITSASSFVVDATNNWWGSASGPGVVGSGTGDKVSNNVDYKPWCTDLGCTTFSSATPITVAASDITSTDTTLNGTNGSYDADNTSFWWGTSSASSFTSTADPSSQLGDWSHDTGLGAKSASDPFSYALTGLTPSTPYHFVAWSLVGGIWYPGTTSSFTTADKYTQAEFNAFDGVNIGTNSYTVSAGITATYDNGTGTESNPVLLKLTGYAPIVTPWFGSSWTTYNYVTIGIKLPVGFTGTTVYQTGVMRYDVNPVGAYKMSSVGDGSTPLATVGAAAGYLDYSFAANSTNTKKDGLVKLQVIWTEGATPEYFTIDVTGLQLAPNVPTATLTANGVNVPTNGYTNSNTFTFNLSSADATRYQLKYWNDIAGSSYKESTPWNPTTLGAVYPDSFTQSEGTHYFAFSACNAADNCSAYSTPFAVTYGKTAPAVPGNPSPANQSYLNTHDFTFSWDAVSDPSIPVSYEWEFSYGTAVRGDGSFTSRSGFHSLTSASVNSPGTPDNIYYWHVRAIDFAGNASAWSPVWKVTVDTNSPVIATHAPVVVEATSSSGAVVNYTNPTATDNIDSTVTVICVPPSGSTFPLGVTTVTCNASDVAGNPATPTTFTVTVQDTTAPTVDYLAPTPNNNQITAQSNQTFAVNSDNDTASCTIDLWGGSGDSMIDNGNGTWSYGPITLPDGSRNYTVTCVDRVGNTTTTAERSLTVDTMGPSTPGTPVDNRNNPTNQISVTWTWDASSDLYSGIDRYEWSIEKDGIQVANNHVAGGTTSKTRQLTWGDGSYVFKVYAVDGLSNVSATATSDSLTLDTTDPETPTIMPPSDGYATSNANPYLDWTDTADTENYRYQICYNNPDVDGFCTEERKVTLSVSERTLINALAEGKYWWRVRSIDYAGNMSPWSLSNSLIIDQTAPNSSVNTLPQYINTEKFNIDVTSADPAATQVLNIAQLITGPATPAIEETGSGVQYVELWYRKDGSSCTTITADSLVMATVVDDCQDGYTRYPGEFDPTQPIEFDTFLTGGDGFYEFFSIAVDNASNRESEPWNLILGMEIQGLDAMGIIGSPEIIPDTSTTVDTTKPVITLNGSAVMDLAFDTAFADPGATTDDGSAVVVSGTVNTNTAGAYVLTYNATDAAGNAAIPVTRTVNVAAAPAPVILTTTTATGTGTGTGTGTDDTIGGTGGEVAGTTIENPAPTPTITSSGDDSNSDVKGAEDAPNWWSAIVFGLARWLWALLTLMLLVGLGYWWLILGKRRTK